MKCPSCGQENPDEERFCGSCGSPLPEPPAPVAAPARPARFRWRFVAIPAIALALLLGGSLCLGLLFGPADQGAPAISGNIVVWRDSRNGNADIYGKNLATGREFAVVQEGLIFWPFR